MALLAILMPVMIGVAAFAINVVYMEMTRTELQISLDVATRAAGRTLAVTEDQAQATAAANLMLQQNPYANQVLSLADTNISFGVSTRNSSGERYAFESGAYPNAVKIETNGNNDVPLLFPTMGLDIPLRPIKTSICTSMEMDVALVLDRSGSMAFAANESSSVGYPMNAPPGWSYGNPAPPQSRWLDAVDAVENFISVLQSSPHDEHLTLTTYASTAVRDVSLTADYDAILNSLDAYSSNFSGGTTAIGDGIINGVDAITQTGQSRPWATRIMIVMTDGIQNTGQDYVYAAQQAASDNVMVYTITFSDEADQSAMQSVANEAAGKHFHAASGIELTHVFEEIAREFPTLVTF